MGARLKDYLSLIKLSHTIFALPFAFIGFFLAVGKHGYDFSWLKLALMLLCMVFVRSAAMAFNRYLDRDIDALNPRTAVREIPAGKISPNNALALTFFCSIAFLVCTAFINPLCLYLSPIALFVVLFYSYTKRFTPLCHLVLGLGLALAPIGAYLVVSEQFHPLPIFVSVLVWTWVAGFDVIYALQDESFDSSQGLYSIPSVLGTKGALMVSKLLHIISGLMVIVIGLYEPWSWLYWFGALIFILLLKRQHTLVSPNDLSKVNIAFMNTNSYASFSYAIFTILAIYLS
jgi:4-hydroxybenzoate polyprenyltransferase